MVWSQGCSLVCPFLRQVNGGPGDLSEDRSVWFRDRLSDMEIVTQVHKLFIILDEMVGDESTTTIGSESVGRHWGTHTGWSGRSSKQLTRCWGAQ